VKRLKRHVIRLRVRLAGLGSSARFVAGVLLATVVCGAVWLIWALASSEPTSVVARGLDAPTLHRAQKALERQGVNSRRTEGGLAVSRRRLADARSILKSEISDANSSPPSLKQLADASGIWCTNFDKKRLWQSRVMAELGRLVTEMDPVDSASVLFEPGSPGGLGSRRKEARAAVKVTMAKGRRMTPDLIVAIGELVSGAVAVEIGDVRVIDQTGRSYRASPKVEALAQRRAVEAHYSDKITSALRYIPGIIADVRIVGTPAGLNSASSGYKLAGEGLRVWISAPRSYVSSGGSREAAAQRLASVKDAVKAILGPSGNHEVLISLHGPTGGDTAVVSPETNAGIGWGVVLIAVVSFAVAGGLGLWLLVRWRGAVRGRPLGLGSNQEDEISDELSYDMLTPFSSEGGDQRNEDLAREHPQTLAIILARMPSSQSTGIVSRLPDELRDEVVRRIGSLGDIDAEVVSDIRRDLSMHFGGGAATASSEAAEPENIDRRRAERDALKLMAFEDIVMLGAAELRVALSAVEPDDLAISLRMAARQVRRKVLGSLASKDAEYVRARMDRIGPMRICDVESARQRVMETVSQAAGAPARSARTAKDLPVEPAV